MTASKVWVLVRQQRHLDTAIVGVYASKDAALAGAMTDWQKEEPQASQDPAAQIGQCHHQVFGGSHVLVDRFQYDAHEFEVRS